MANQWWFMACSVALGRSRVLPGGGFLRMRGGLGAMRCTVDHEEASRQDDFAA